LSQILVQGETYAVRKEIYTAKCYILLMFYQHWLISYAHLGSEYARMSIREVVERIRS
jgi:hypothetical protein